MPERKKKLTGHLNGLRLCVAASESGNGLDWEGDIPEVDVVLTGGGAEHVSGKFPEEGENQVVLHRIDAPEEGHSPYLCFLDRAAEVLPHALDEMAWTLEKRPDIDRVGARILRREDGFLPESCYGKHRTVDEPEFSFLHREEMIYESCFMVRRAAWEKRAEEEENLAERKGDCVAPFAWMLLPEAEAGRVLTWSRAPREKRQRVLYFDAEVPMADRGSGGMDAIFFLDWMIKRGMEVVFFGDYTAGYVPKYTTILLRRGVECVYLPYRTAAEYLEEEGGSFEWVFLSRIYVAETFDLLLRRYCMNAAWIFNTVDLHFVREKMEAELHNSERERKNAENTGLLELSFLSLCDAGIVISSDELHLLEERYGLCNIRHIPQARRLSGRGKGFEGRRGMVFIGSAHLPNVDAVICYAREIAPLVAKFAPELRLTVIGEELHEALKKTPEYNEILRGGKVEFAGFVPDLREYLDECVLTIAPLRYGAGTKGKVASSLCCGVPCVCSDFGSEGTGMTDGVDFLAASTAEEFAEAIRRLLTDGALWERLSTGGMEFIRQNYSFDRVERLMDELFAFAWERRNERLRRISLFGASPDGGGKAFEGSHEISAAVCREALEYFDLPRSFRIALCFPGAEAVAGPLRERFPNLECPPEAGGKKSYSFFLAELPEGASPERFVRKLHACTLPGGRALLAVPEAYGAEDLEKCLKKSRAFLCRGVWKTRDGKTSLLYFQRHIPEMVVCSNLARLGISYLSLGNLKSEVMRRLPVKLRVPAKRFYQRLKQLF